MTNLSIVAISGSLRTGSYNRMLLRVAMQAAQTAGAAVTELDLKQLNLPIYDRDIENVGLPESVQLFRNAIIACDVLLIASPEYNHSIPGGLKNAIDWASRKKPTNVLDGKVAAIMGASSGRYGTVRMQPHLRQVLGALNVFLVPQPQIMLSSAKEAFTPDGQLRDAEVAERVQQLVITALSCAQRLRQTEG